MPKYISLSRARRVWKKETQACLLLGHSHTVALRLAAEADEQIANWLDICTIAREKLQPEVSLKKKGYALHPGLKARLKSKKYQSLALSIGGGPHVIMGLPQAPEAFDFILPSEPDLPLIKGARLLPYDAVLETVRVRNIPNQHILQTLANSFDGPIVHLDYPPPVPDSWALRHPRAFAQAFDTQGLTPLSLRYKLWRVNLQVMTELLAACSIQRLQVPNGMIAANGALPPAALFPDPVHGNAHYGQAVAQQLQEMLRSA